MQYEAALLREMPLSIADAPHPDDEWAKSPVSKLSDAALAGAVAAAIARPKRTADSSFLTHAPLELAARAALLPSVAPGARDRARRRIARIAAEYARQGDEIDGAGRIYPNRQAALQYLAGALKEGDAEEADKALLFLAPCTSLPTLRRALVPAVTPMLGAAAHAPILLAELPRIEARLDRAASLLRAPLRQIANMAAVRISWHERAGADEFSADAESELFSRLACAPPVRCASPCIAPTMLAIEADEYAENSLADVTSGLSVEAAGRAILRIGALSMLQDDPEHAPYGWSHALTMPQGVLGCADAASDRAMIVRIAATHALGFRATLGRARIVNEPPPRPRSGAFLDVEPIVAAGAVFHAPEEKLPEIRTALATRAATHEDAHLAKYTLACFDAAARDSEAARLFCAAAAYLGAWWDAHPGAAFE